MVKAAMTKLKYKILISHWTTFPVKTAPPEICCNIGATVWVRGQGYNNEIEKMVSACKILCYRGMLGIGGPING